MKHPQLIETKAAVLERTGERMVEVRFKPDVKLDVAGLGEIVQAKHELCATAEADILIVLPPDLDFELNVLAIDHHAAHGGCGLSKRLALAAATAFNERLASIYFRYHPRASETAVFVEEADARAWLTQGLAQPSLS